MVSEKLRREIMAVQKENDRKLRKLLRAADRWRKPLCEAGR